MAIHLLDGLKDYSLKDYFPIFIVVSAYILFRPYLVKIGETIQKRQYRKMSEENAKQAGIEALQPPNPDGQFIEETEASVWGRNARKRQKDKIKEIEKAFKRKQEMEGDDEDAEIADLLIKE
ncbi:protein trafficking Pga2 [Lipomyces arxii]|uniref:protein trafficking Pga2 n=1 Tax=Lipomyces arxii TaxID=56418 RepID=UPI0034CEE398